YPAETKGGTWSSSASTTLSRRLTVRTGIASSASVRPSISSSVSREPTSEDQERTEDEARHARSTKNYLLGLRSPGDAEALAIFDERGRPVVGVSKADDHAALHVGVPLLERRSAFERHGHNQVGNERTHAPHHLHARGAVRDDLPKRQPQVVIPRRERHDNAQPSRRVMERADLEPPPAETQQQIADLIEGLHSRRWIVDRRRQRPNGDVDEQSNRVLRVLV